MEDGGYLVNAVELPALLVWRPATAIALTRAPVKADRAVARRSGSQLPTVQGELVAGDGPMSLR
jgi:hypothetical protein